MLAPVVKACIGEVPVSNLDCNNCINWRFS